MYSFFFVFEQHRFLSWPQGTPSPLIPVNLGPGNSCMHQTWTVPQPLSPTAPLTAWPRPLQSDGSGAEPLLPALPSRLSPLQWWGIRRMVEPAISGRKAQKDCFELHSMAHFHSTSVGREDYIFDFSSMIHDLFPVFPQYFQFLF